MKNLTRVLALVLTFAMMISSVAFAATFTDIEAGSTYAEATAVLADLGILKGYEDGSFGADKVITRAEVVAVVNRLQGLSDAAKAAGGATQYTDVPSTEWYAGDVNLATQMGIVSGDGNGLFRPNDQVKYEEAVKMVVAALGYNQEYVLKRGGWPTGYLVIATEAEISKGVAAGAGEPAYRGIVAKLAYNALTAPTFAFNSYSTDGKAIYTVNDEKITLEEKLQAYKLTGYVAANATTGLGFATTENDEVVFKFTDDKVGKDISAWADGKNDKFLVGATDVANTLGFTTDIYVKLNADNEYEIVSYVLNNAKNKTVTIANTSDIQTTGADASDLDGVGIDYISVKGEEDATRTEYKLENTVVGSVYAELIVNGKSLGAIQTNAATDMYDIAGTATAALGKIYAPKYGEVTLLDNDNNGAYDFVFVTSYVVARVEDVVDSVSSKKIWIDGAVINLADHIDGKKGYTYSIELDGAEAKLSDLQKDDIIAVAMTDNGSAYDIKATRKTVSGLVTETIKDGTIEEYEFVVDGTTYKVANLADKSKAGLASVKAGNEVTFYLDAFGNVAYTDRTSSTAQNYGFVAGLHQDTGSIDGTTHQVRILDKEGNMKVYDIADNAKIALNTSNDGIADDASGASAVYGALNTYMNPSAFAGNLAADNWTIKLAKDAANYNDAVKNYAKRIITYRVNSAGKISEIIVGSTTAALGEDNFITYDNNVASLKYTAKSASIGGTMVSGDTVVFNLAIDANADKDNFEVGTIASLANDETYNVAFLSVNKDGVAGAIVITNNAATVGKDSNLAVVTRVTTSQDENYEEIYNISFLQNGETKTLSTTAQLKSDLGSKVISAGDVFEYALDAEGAINAIGLSTGKDATWNGTLATVGTTVAIDDAHDEVYNDTAKQDYVFGVVYGKSSDSRIIRIGSGKVIHAVAEDANIYMVDLAKVKAKAKNPVTVSSYSELRAYNAINVADTDYAVFMKYSNDEVIDVVIYKGYITEGYDAL